MSDVDKLVAELNRRKKRAETLALPEALCSFYDKARFYPSWKNNQPLLVPNGLEELGNLDGASDSVKFVYQGKRYCLQLSKSGSTPDGDSLGRIELQIDETRVFEIIVTRSVGDWFPGQVTAFAEGPWISPFKTLAGEAERLYEKQSKIGFQDVDDLRARFNIAPGYRLHWLTRIKDCLSEWLKRANKP